MAPYALRLLFWHIRCYAPSAHRTDCVCLHNWMSLTHFVDFSQDRCHTEYYMDENKCERHRLYNGILCIRSRSHFQNSTFYQVFICLVEYLIQKTWICVQPAFKNWSDEVISGDGMWHDWIWMCLVAFVLPVELSDTTMVPS